MLDVRLKSGRRANKRLVLNLWHYDKARRQAIKYLQNLGVTDWVQIGGVIYYEIDKEGSYDAR